MHKICKRTILTGRACDSIELWSASGGKWERELVNTLRKGNTILFLSSIFEKKNIQSLCVYPWSGDFTSKWKIFENFFDTRLDNKHFIISSKTRVSRLLGFAYLRWRISHKNWISRTTLLVKQHWNRCDLFSFGFLLFVLSCCYCIK